MKPKKWIWQTQQRLFSEILTHWLKNNPQTLLWAVSCQNCFLSVALYRYAEGNMLLLVDRRLVVETGRGVRIDGVLQDGAVTSATFHEQTHASFCAVIQQESSKVCGFSWVSRRDFQKSYFGSLSIAGKVPSGSFTLTKGRLFYRLFKSHNKIIQRDNWTIKVRGKNVMDYCQKNKQTTSCSLN